MEYKYNSPIAYMIFFIICLGFSVLINTIFLKFTKTLGIRKNTDQQTIRWESKQKPAIGGISIYIIFLLSLIAFEIIFKQGSELLNKQIIGFVGAVSLGFLMGLADDAYNTVPFLKLLTQITCGLILAFTGTFINIFSLDIFNYILTVVWVVAVMNSINLIDNMDAVSSIISIFINIAAISILVISTNLNEIYFTMLIGVSAALIGFLYHNWHPSKIYMGDTGTQFLGVFLATIGIACFWNFGDSQIIDGQIKENSTSLLSISKNLIFIILIFILPISDTATVIINRLMKGQSPMIGGKDHTTHHLHYLGLSEKHIAILFMVISFISIIMIIIISMFIANWTWLYFSLFFTYFVIVGGGLYTTTKLSKEPETEKQ